MTQINSILYTGNLGLFAAMNGIQVSGNNIANVNTEGYSRQNVMLTPVSLGGGVRVDEIRRERNEFLEKSFIASTNQLGTARARADMYQQIESIFNETSKDGYSVKLSEFFSALQGLSVNPGGTGEREAVRMTAADLTSQVRNMYDDILELQENYEVRIGEQVTRANTLIQQISEFNQVIIQSGPGTISLNALLDQRQRALTELAEIVPIEYFESEDGTFNVLLSGGHSLVEGTNFNTLDTRINPENNGLLDIYIRDDSGVTTRINDKIRKGGLLQGIITTRDNMVGGMLNDIDVMIASFIRDFNEIHKAGTGLDGSTGVDFFSPLEVYSESHAENTGGAEITSSDILNNSALTMHNYEIRFTAADTYDIVDTTLGTTVAAGQAYTAGGAITFDGISITIDDGSGTPLEGDVFTVNTTKGAAENFSVSTEIENSVLAIAAGYTDETGDNRNALDLIALQDSLAFNDGTATYQDYYIGLITSLGIDSVSAQNMLRSADTNFEQAKNFLESVRGVSLEEENINLIKFQSAFEASAKVIQVADDMIATVLQLVD